MFTLWLSSGIVFVLPSYGFPQSTEGLVANGILIHNFVKEECLGLLYEDQLYSLEGE